MNANDGELTLEEAIFSASVPSDPRISPDGRIVVWTARPYGISGEHAENTLWIAPADGSEPGRQFTSGGWSDTSPRWSPDGRSIAFLSDRAERGTAGLYLMPVDGGEALPLVQRKASIQTLAWSPDGRSIAFTCPDDPTEEEKRRSEERDDPDVYGEKWPNARLFLVDVESGVVHQLATGEQHVVEVAWSPDSSSRAFLATATPELEARVHSQIFTIAQNDDRPNLVCTLTGIMTARLTWSSDGQTLAFLSGHEPRLTSATVFAVDADGGEPRVVGPDATEDASATNLQSVAGDDRLVITVAQGLSSRLEWLDPSTGARELLYQPDEGDIEPDVSVVSTDQSGLVLATISSTGSQPQEIHVGSPEALTRVSDHHATLRQFTFGEQEPFYWTSPDGLELDGILIRPPGGTTTPLPTIVHVHGGPYGRYSDGWNLRPGHWAQWMAAHGYAVLMPNYRGGMGHGNEFARWGNGGVGDMEFVDVMSSVDAAIERGIADPDRLGIGGWSQGGFMTAWAVTQTNRFKAGVMGAGVSDWGMMVMTSDIPTIESMLGGGRPWDGPGPHRFMQHSPISHARNAKTPLLMLHGKEDPRVPVTQAIGFHRALLENGVETELVTYPREPHGLRERNHQIDSFRRVRDWFQRYV